MAKVRQIKTRRAGYLLTEATMAIGLLGLLVFVIARIETRAASTAQALEQKYVATAAAESQFERLKAGLDVLDARTFERRYPSLRLDYQVRPAEKNAPPVAVVTVTAAKADKGVLARLVGPVPTATMPSGGRQP